MNQMVFPVLEEDVLVSSIRREENLCDKVIEDILSGVVTPWDVIEQLKRIERDLRRISYAQ